jgi:hypothetical protein
MTKEQYGKCPFCGSPPNGDVTHYCLRTYQIRGEFGDGGPDNDIGLTLIAAHSKREALEIYLRGNLLHGGTMLVGEDAANNGGVYRGGERFYAVEMPRHTSSGWPSA